VPDVLLGNGACPLSMAGERMYNNVVLECDFEGWGHPPNLHCDRFSIVLPSHLSTKKITARHRLDGARALQ